MNFEFAVVHFDELPQRFMLMEERGWSFVAITYQGNRFYLCIWRKA